MELQKDLSELERKHRALEREIQDEMSHPGADETTAAGGAVLAGGDDGALRRAL